MKKTKKLVLAKETVRNLELDLKSLAGGGDTKSVYWSCVCTDSGMYTCACNNPQ
jgi:hypothetical protein